MKILFYCGYSRPVGTNFPVYGSEIALRELGYRMADYGHDVYVSGEYPMVQDQTRLKIVSPADLQSMEVDVLIVSRYMYYFLNYSIKAKKIYVWLHDTILNSGVILPGIGTHPHRSFIPNDSRWLISNLDQKISGYIVLTQWHRELFRNVYKEIPEDKIFVIGNGGPQPCNDYSKKVPGRLIYTSSPIRGLDTLLNLFTSHIHVRYPQTTLHIIRGREEFPPELLKRLDDGIEGVKYLGFLTPDKVEEEFKQAEIYVYPTNYQETYCMSVHEAQAYGCVVVASKLAALCETVGDRGFLVDRPYASPEYRTDILGLIDTVLDMGLWSKSNLRKKSYSWCQEHTWEKQAQKWLELFGHSSDLSDVSNTSTTSTTTQLSDASFEMIESVRPDNGPPPPMEPEIKVPEPSVVVVETTPQTPQVEVRPQETSQQQETPTVTVVPHANWTTDPVAYIQRLEIPEEYTRLHSVSKLGTSLRLPVSSENHEATSHESTNHGITRHVVINAPHPEDKSVIPDDAIILSMEPSYNRDHFDRRYIDKGVFIPRNLLEWHLKHIKPSSEISKTKVLSAIVSGEDRLPGHKLRNKFIEYIDDVYTYDLYGKKPSKLVNYSGPLVNKDDGIYPYKYHIAIENGREAGYFTEKLLDGILGECLVFYYGASDLNEWMDTRAVITIDITDPFKAFDTIVKSIEADEYTKRLPFIRQQKERLLSLTVCPTISRLVNGTQHPDILTIVVNLDRRQDRWAEFQHNAVNVIDWYIRMSAYDGQTITRNQIVTDLCDLDRKVIKWWRNPYKGHDNNAAVIGCILSHYVLWESLIASHHDYLVVLEDDVQLCGDYTKRMTQLYGLINTLMKDNYDIIYLGVTDGNDETYGDVAAYKSPSDEVRYCNPEPIRNHGGGSFGYIISKQGATHLRDLVKKYPMSIPLDWWLIEMYRHTRSFKVWPHMVTSKVASTHTDSDIQFSTRSI
jgi:GR25 family glycosyltransferase involved in LPS biosynthesis/glycosyltransferase involved in cell wall biosynthesis